MQRCRSAALCSDNGGPRWASSQLPPSYRLRAGRVTGGGRALHPGLLATAAGTPPDAIVIAAVLCAAFEEEATVTFAEIASGVPLSRARVEVADTATGNEQVELPRPQCARD